MRKSTAYKRVIAGITLVAMTTCMTGCGKDALQQEMLSAQSNNQSIKIASVGDVNTNARDDITWGELDQLTTFDDIRHTWDDKMQIVKFDNSSKNGVLYIDLDGNWTGNNTLYNAFQNKTFVDKYWSDGQIKSALAKSAMEQFSDITNESTGIYAAINAYYNIFPTNKDKTSGLTDNISRAEAMSAIYRGDTQAVFEEEDKDFKKAVGKSQYNLYAFGTAEDSFLDYKNGSLCYDTYNDCVTRAEVLYMLVQRYWKDEYDKVTVENAGFSDCNNAGDIAKKLGIKGKYAWQAYELDYCLQTGCGCPEDLYKALIVAKNHGLVSSETSWNQPVMGGVLLNYMIEAYQSIYKTNGFAVNAKLGENAGVSFVATAENTDTTPDVTEQTIGGVVVSQIRDVTNLDDLFKIYGDEINMTDAEKESAYKTADDWTFSPADQWMEVAHCGWLNERTGPSTDYNILSSVPSGTKCHIVAVCKENGWYRIIANNKIVYQCGVYFKDFEGSKDYLMRTGENANDY